jgi:hypothetical protein
VARSPEASMHCEMLHPAVLATTIVKTQIVIDENLSDIPSEQKSGRFLSLFKNDIPNLKITTTQTAKLTNNLWA